MAKRPVGRPSVYTPKLLEKAQDYLKNFDTKYEDVMPMLCGLGEVIGVHKDTIQAWAKDKNKPEFSVLVKQVMQKQEKVLFNRGLTNEFNSNLTKLALCKHGYADKQEIDTRSIVIVEMPSKDASNL